MRVPALHPAGTQNPCLGTWKPFPAGTRVDFRAFVHRDGKRAALMADSKANHDRLAPRRLWDNDVCGGDAPLAHVIIYPNALVLEALLRRRTLDEHFLVREHDFLHVQSSAFNLVQQLLADSLSLLHVRGGAPLGRGLLGALFHGAREDAANGALRRTDITRHGARRLARVVAPSVLQLSLVCRFVMFRLGPWSVLPASINARPQLLHHFLHATKGVSWVRTQLDESGGADTLFESILNGAKLFL